MMTSNERGIAGLQDLEVKLKRVDPQLRARLVAGSVERVDFIGCCPSIFSLGASALGRSWPGSSLS